jgi:hypothetical protein
MLNLPQSDHPDYSDVKDALEDMRNVAAGVNESRRRREGLESLVKWEMNVSNWDGLKILETSSLMIHQGEVFALKGTNYSNQRPKELSLFLFDHLLIYCRKVRLSLKLLLFFKCFQQSRFVQQDLLKKSSYIYRGRASLDECKIMDCADGLDEHLGVVLKNAWKVVNMEHNHYFLFFTRTAEEKNNWLQAFREERLQIVRDYENRIVFTEKDKLQAQQAACSIRNKPRRPKSIKLKFEFFTCC